MLVGMLVRSEGVHGRGVTRGIEVVEDLARGCVDQSDQGVALRRKRQKGRAANKGARRE